MAFAFSYGVADRSFDLPTSSAVARPIGGYTRGAFVRLSRGRRARLRRASGAQPKTHTIQTRVSPDFGVDPAFGGNS